MFKQIKELKKLQASLDKEVIEIEKKGIKVIVSGKMEIVDISLNDQLPVKEQETTLKDCLNEAFKKVQYLAAQKMGIF